MNSSDLYDECRIASSLKLEAQDCTVMALAIATGEGYNMAHYAMEDCGRMRWRATSMNTMGQAAKALGYTMTKVLPRYYKDTAKTAITAERLGWKGSYLIEYDGHVAAMVDSNIHDWTSGRRHRILDIWLVKPE